MNKPGPSDHAPVVVDLANWFWEAPVMPMSGRPG